MPYCYSLRDIGPTSINCFIQKQIRDFQTDKTRTLTLNTTVHLIKALKEISKYISACQKVIYT